MIKDSDWKTAGISPTCEVIVGPKQSDLSYPKCDKPTSYAYPASGRGWMALCDEHAKSHKEATHIDELIGIHGEKWERA